jgi:hypothetical protein
MAGEYGLRTSSAEPWLCLLLLLCEIQAFSDSGRSTLERCLTAFGMFCDEVRGGMALGEANGEKGTSGMMRCL